MSTPKGNSSSVVIHPQACCIMAMHATQNRHDTVRGFLLGSVDDSTATTQVRWAVPVAHGPVTGPLVELALGLCEAAPLGQDKGEGNTVVGWYTAPSLLLDRSASAVDARIASSLTAASSSARKSGGDGGILLVMQNESLGSVLKGDNGSVGKLFTASTAAASEAKREVLVVESVKAARATREAIQQGLVVDDFVDHLEKTSAAESTWLQYESVVDLIKKC